MAKNKRRSKSLKSTAAKSKPEKQYCDVQTASSVNQQVQGKILLKGWRLWFIRIAMTVLAPVVLVALIEGVLALSGYGYPTKFYLETSSGTALRDNDKFAWQYHTPSTKLQPHPFIIHAKKPRNMIRIFILGESAALGTPEPAYGFARILEFMLKSQYPEKNIQVINAAMRGINSHVILKIAQDCVELEPDLFIAYIGNNETVGVHAPKPDSFEFRLNLSFIRASQWMRSSHFGQFLWAQFKVGGGKDKQDMPYFREHRIPADDWRCAKVHQNFHNNLEDILNVVQKSGTKVVLSTVASNLKDFPPLGSLHRTDLSEPEQESWRSTYAMGVIHEDQGHYEKAIEQYLVAHQIDDHYAELHYRLGRCYLANSNNQKALKHFIMARDWDALPFRSVTVMNDLIESLANQRKSDDLHFVDVEEALRNSHTNEASPNEFFYDHVHFNFDGDFLVAKTLFPVVEAALGDRLGDSRTGNNTSPTPKECRDYLGYTQINESQLISGIIGTMLRPPFMDQLDFAKRQERMNRELQSRFRGIQAEDVQRDSEILRQALAINPNDWQLYHNFGVFYSAINDQASALRQLQKSKELMPHHLKTRMMIISILAKMGQSSAALKELDQVLQINPHFKPALEAIKSFPGK